MEFFINQIETDEGKKVTKRPREEEDEIDDEELLREYMETSSEDSSSSPPPQKEFSFDEKRNLHKRAIEIGQAVIDQYKKEPEISPDSRYNENDYINNLFHIYFFAIQHIILFHKYDGNVPPVNILVDNEETIREKAYYLHLYNCYMRFNHIVKEIATNVFETFKKRVCDKLGEGSDHPVLDILNCITKYKEMHSRRLKLDPNAKSDEIRPTYNSVTFEIYNNEIKEHRVWRHIFFVPLPSDIDFRQRDPKEGDVLDPEKDKGVYVTNVKLDIMNGNYNIPEPFGYVVGNEWDRMFRIIHVLYHFPDYFYTYITKGILENQWATITKLSCKDSWSYLTDKKTLPEPRHGNETEYSLWITRLNKEKKSSSILLYRIAVLRDMLEAGIKFR